MKNKVLGIVFLGTFFAASAMGMENKDRITKPSYSIKKVKDKIIAQANFTFFDNLDSASIMVHKIFGADDFSVIEVVITQDGWFKNFRDDGSSFNNIVLDLKSNIIDFEKAEKEKEEKEKTEKKLDFVNEKK